jgi:hypothetical protein
MDRLPQKLASRRLSGRPPEILQLSPVSTRLIQMCDGSRTATEIGALLPPELVAGRGIPVDKYCLVGMELLRRDGLLRDAEPPHEQAEAHARS